MENYILKLNSGTEYKLYKGTTLVSDADLTALFGVAGEMYLSFDFNSGTPSDLTTFTITDSSDIAVISNSNLTDTVAEGKNYKATWSNSATTFDTFEELEGKALDESQLSFLMGKIKDAASKGVETVTVTYDTTLWDLLGGEAAVNKVFLINNPSINTIRLSFRKNSSTSGSNWCIWLNSYASALIVVMPSTSGSKMVIGVKYTSNSFESDQGYGAIFFSGAYGVSTPNVKYLQLNVIDALTSTATMAPLAANQGKVLNEKIGDLTTLTTTAKTSTVAAINEVDSNLNDAAYVGNVLATPSSVVYVATDNIQDGAVTSDKIDFTTLIDKIYPVGSIYMSANNVSPATFIGGTWTAWGAGRVPVGVDTSDTSFNTVEKTGGSKDLQQHAHGLPVGNIAYYVGDSSGQSNFTGGNSCQFWSTNVSTNNAGTGNSGNLQPYITCYMWKRTA